MAADLSEDVEVTPAMIEAGADAIREEIGDPDCLPGHFSAKALAELVYRAMANAAP